MIMQRTALGRWGEAVARTYLENNGYAVGEQNYRTRYGEIDLVAKKKDLLVFVEVRTKGGEMFGTPEDSLTRKKLLQLVKNAKAYVARKKYKGMCRIDAICIVAGTQDEPERISHYENITDGLKIFKVV